MRIYHFVPLLLSSTQMFRRRAAPQCILLSINCLQKKSLAILSIADEHPSSALNDSDQFKRKYHFSMNSRASQLQQTPSNRTKNSRARAPRKHTRHLPNNCEYGVKMWCHFQNSSHRTSLAVDFAHCTIRTSIFCVRPISDCYIDWLGQSMRVIAFPILVRTLLPFVTGAPLTCSAWRSLCGPSKHVHFSRLSIQIVGCNQWARLASNLARQPFHHSAPRTTADHHFQKCAQPK